DYAVTVVAANEVEVLSRLTLSVRSSRGVNGRSEGTATALTLNTGLARGATGEAASAMNLRLRGFLLPGVDVNGHLALRSAGAGGSALSRSLGRHGLGGGTAYLSLSSRGWK